MKNKKTTIKCSIAVELFGDYALLKIKGTENDKSSYCDCYITSAGYYLFRNKFIKHKYLKDEYYIHLYATFEDNCIRTIKNKHKQFKLNNYLVYVR